jgi:hypothetical protein
MMRWLFILLGAGLLLACGDEAGGSTTGGVGGDGATTSTGGGGSGGTAGAGGSEPMALTPCLDRPDTLMRPPSGQLPCEYIPPGLSLTR